VKSKFYFVKRAASHTLVEQLLWRAESQRAVIIRDPGNGYGGRACTDDQFEKVVGLKDSVLFLSLPADAGHRQPYFSFAAFYSP
jgi:hypothetical protein